MEPVFRRETDTKMGGILQESGRRIKGCLCLETSFSCAHGDTWRGIVIGSFFKEGIDEEAKEHGLTGEGKGGQRRDDFDMKTTMSQAGDFGDGFGDVDGL